MGQYVDPINEGLVSQVLSFKDKKYDYNVAKIDGLIQQYTNLPLAREQDKQYLKERLDTLVSTVNQTAKLDMSDNNFERRIEQTIGAAVDDNVIHNMGVTRSIMNFEQDVAQKREKKPELYSDINYTYAKTMAGYDKYMSGETDNMGNLQYVDYKDVPKKINDFIVDVQNKKKDQVIQLPTKDEYGNIIPGSFTETTISGLNMFQVRQLAESQLDASHQRQIEINGWYSAGGYDNKEKISADINTVFENSMKNLEIRKSELEGMLQVSGKSTREIANMQAELEGISSQKSGLQKNKDFLLSNTTAAATYLEKERVLTNAQDAFGSLYSESKKLVKDEIYFAQQDLNLKKLKLQYDIEKDQKTATIDASAPNAIVNTLGTSTEMPIQEIESFVDTTIDKYNMALDSDLNAYKNAIRTEAAKGNKDAIQVWDEFNKKLSVKTADQTENDVFSSVVSKKDYNSNIAIIGNRNYMADIKSNKERLNLLLEGKKNATEESKISHIDSTINTEKTFKAFYDNPDTKMLWTGSDGKQHAFAVKDVLIKSGLMDASGKKIGDLKTRPKILAELQKSFYADSYLSTPTKRKDMLKNLADSFGEKYDDVVIKGNPSSYASTSPTTGISTYQQYTPEKLNPNSKTAQYIAQAERNGIKDTFGFSDQSLSGDDSTIGRFLSTDYRTNDLYKQNLEKFYDKLPTTQVVGITAQDKEAYNRLGALVTSQPGSTFTPEALSKNATINLRMEGDYIIASQNQSSTSKGVTTTSPVSTKILKKDFLRYMPELSNKLDFTTEAAFYTLDKLEGRTLKSESIKFFGDETSSKNYEWSRNVLLGNNPRLVPYMDSSHASATLLNENRILEQQYPELPTIINKALDESSNYCVNAQVERGFDGKPVVDIKLIDKQTEQVIHSIKNTEGVNLDNFTQVLEGAPQVFYGLILKDILDRERFQMMTTGSTTPSKAFKKLKDSL